MTNDRNLLLVNDMALQLRPEIVALAGSDRVIVAGANLVRMTLAEVAWPGAEMVWTDFRHSASLGALHSRVQAAGGLDRLVLAADGDRGEAVFSVMCCVLTLLPSLRGKDTSRVELSCTQGKAARSLVQFVKRIQPQLATTGVRLSLDFLEHREDLTAA